ncbi:MAG TPA: hypothetical protein ENN40_04575 [Candidatus Aminicenantes bacterium]|nr:hypothetical protein [Candidatus Aminicenantes bacterium]
MSNKTCKTIRSLLITHGQLGQELKAVAEKILERDSDIETITITWGEDGSRILNKIETFMRHHSGGPLIIFTDMFGGSPSNVCFPYISPDVEVITGINLPGLLKFLTYREKDIPFKELVCIIRKGAIDGINVMGEYLGEKSHGRSKG